MIRYYLRRNPKLVEAKLSIVQHIFIFAGKIAATDYKEPLLNCLVELKPYIYIHNNIFITAKYLYKKYDILIHVKNERDKRNTILRNID